MRRSRFLISSIGTALLAAAVTAGCGGGSQQVTASELVQKADEICASERDEFARIQATPPPNASAAHDQTRQLIDQAESSLTDLKNLEPPPDIRPAYDRYLTAVNRAIDVMRDGADAADNRDSNAYVSAQIDVTKTEAKREQLARSLGFQNCSKPGV